MALYEETLLKTLEQTMKKVAIAVSPHHHKRCDGNIYLRYDAWNEEWTIEYYGYNLGKFEFADEDLDIAVGISIKDLELKLEKFKATMKEIEKSEKKGSK